MNAQPHQQRSLIKNAIAARTANLLWKSLLLCACASICAAFAGCGTTISHSATEQLLASDAVDRAVNKINFDVLANQKVFLDDKYAKNVKSVGFVNADYIISSIRQQLVAAGCLMQENNTSADYIAEVRIGAIGTDTMEITYGLPASNALSSAASLVSSAPVIPTIPEISIAKKNDYSSAAKVAVFAYHRETREPVWQSGVAQARSLARDTWILGAGPFQKGTIYDKTQFAGSELTLPFLSDGQNHGPETRYVYERVFKTPGRITKQIADAATAKAEAKKAATAAAAAAAEAKAQAPVAKKKSAAKEQKAAAAAAAAATNVKNLQSMNSSARSASLKPNPA